MANKPIYEDPYRTNLLIERRLLKAANRYLRQQGFGSFSEYVARLCSADLGSETSAAHAGRRVIIKKVTSVL